MCWRTSGKGGYFYPRPPHGERLNAEDVGAASSTISIHAPRMGSDALHGGVIGPHCEFLSTPPAWGATSQQCCTDTTSAEFLSTPPAWGATPCVGRIRFGSMAFLSTPPAWGATARGCNREYRRVQFLSTPPAWGATVSTVRPCKLLKISIHAPRMGSDHCTA